MYILWTIYMFALRVMKYIVCFRYDFYWLSYACRLFLFLFYILMGFLLSTKCLLANTHSSSPQFLCSRPYHPSQIVCLNQNVEGIVSQILCFEFCPQLSSATSTNSYENRFSHFPSSSEQYILLLISFCHFLNHFSIEDLP